MTAGVTIERGLARTSYGQIHYRTAGSGTPIVLMHINQQSSALYIELIEALARGGLRPIAIDYPSHGMSDHLAKQPTIGDYARCVIEVLDAMGLAGARAHALGEATGAAVAIALGADYPSRIDRVVLVNCPIYLTKKVADGRHAPLKSGLRPEDASGFPMTRTLDFVLERDPDHSPVHPTQSWMDRINLAQIEAGRDRWQALDALHEYDIASEMTRVKRPVLMLVGEHFYYVKHRDEFARRIDDFSMEILPGGRFCMGWERAEEIGAKTVAFAGGKGG